MSDRRHEFEVLAMPHLDAAYNLARWLARPPVEAEDVVQDAMLRAFRAFDGVRAETVKPWLMAIVRNCFRDHAVRGGRGGGAGEEVLAALPWDGADPEEEAARASERRALDEALASLPSDYREVLVLREIEDMSYREIAEAIDAPIGTVMSRLARARALLKDRWLAEDAR